MKGLPVVYIGTFKVLRQTFNRVRYIRAGALCEIEKDTNPTSIGQI